MQKAQIALSVSKAGKGNQVFLKMIILDPLGKRVVQTVETYQFLLTEALHQTLTVLKIALAREDQKI